MTNERRSRLLIAQAIQTAIAAHRDDFDHGIADGEAGKSFDPPNDPKIDKPTYVVGYTIGLRRRRERSPTGRPERTG
jgi:hypothetical protein